MGIGMRSAIWDVNPCFLVCSQVAESDLSEGEGHLRNAAQKGLCLQGTLCLQEQLWATDCREAAKNIPGYVSVAAMCRS